MQGGDYQERIAYVRGPEQALVVGAVSCRESASRHHERCRCSIRSATSREGNFMQDMRGLGKRINYLLQEEPNPIMSASDLWKLVEINRLFFGNVRVYRARRVRIPAALVAR